MACVYKLTDASTGDYYIGSTKNIRDRKKQHFSKLRHGKHPSIELQSRYNDGHKVIIEPYIICREEDMIGFEQKALIVLKPVFNTAIDAKSPMKGRKHTAETKQSMSHSQGVKRKFRKITEETVIDILNSSLSYNELAKKYNIGKTQVARIKTGEIHSDVAVNIPRVNKQKRTHLNEEQLNEIKNSSEKNCVLAYKYGIDATSVSKLKSRHKLKQRNTRNI